MRENTCSLNLGVDAKNHLQKNETTGKDFSQFLAGHSDRMLNDGTSGSFTNVSSVSTNVQTDSAFSKTGDISETRNPDIELWLPLPGNRANARMSHIKAYRLKEEYYERCHLELMVRGIKNLPNLVRATYEVLVITTQAYDNDNLAALLKWPQDFLEKMAIIEKDGPTFLWPRRFPFQKVTATMGKRTRGKMAASQPMGIYYRLWKANLEEIERRSACDW